MDASTPDPADFRSQLEAQRPYLMRYAALQLRDAHAAEDAVQEALLAAIGAEASFAGRSNLRTWLTGILKHKIIDAIRKASRDQTVSLDALTEFTSIDDLFDARGHWVDRPAEWAEPQAALQSREFFSVLENCLARLPDKTAQVFMMREHLGLDTAEICKEVGITPTHCWVLLYRARMSLRLCLEERWFDAQKKRR